MNKSPVALDRKALCDRLRSYTFAGLDHLHQALLFEILDSEREHRTPDFADLLAGLHLLIVGRAGLRAELAAFDKTRGAA